MKIRKTIIIFSVLLLSSCGLDKMATDYNKVKIMSSPEILEVHGGNIEVKIKGSFPSEYFAKQATLELTPVIIDLNGTESELKSIILQGETATGGEKTIFYEPGGDFSYSSEIEYDPSMFWCTLEMRAVAKMYEQTKMLDSRTISKGTIATSKRVQNNEISAFADHEYEDTTILSESATIYFLVNKSNIRTSEKSREDVKKLREFIKKGYETESFEIKSYASPEGSVSINDELSKNRNKNTLKYAKYLLQKIKADGSSNDENYTTTSVGEDWDGFYNLMKESSITDKEIINRIVQSNKDPEEKEQAIRDMAEVYDAIDKDILPYLRKAEITINAYEPKKSKEDIIYLSTHSPSELTVQELLYSASLQESLEDKFHIYKSVIDLHNDWRAYNNIAAIYIQLIGSIVIFDPMQTEPIIIDPDGIISAKIYDRDIKKSELHAFIKEWLNESIKNGGEGKPEVLTNLGIIDSWNGDLDKAKTLFDKANTSNHNKAILSIRMGDYRSSSRYYRGKNTYNASLSSVLNKNYDNPCKEETWNCYYLNAIIGARIKDDRMIFKNLEAAILLFPYCKNQAYEDLEFLEYREDPRFILLTK